jgi:sulfonate dioxygenase
VTVSGEKPFYDPASGTQAKAWEATAKAIVERQEAADKAAEKAKASAQGTASSTTA